MSAPYQVPADEGVCDSRVTGLASVMSDAFAFVHNIDPPKTIETHGKCVTLLIQKVMECGCFIAKYIQPEDFCELQSCLLSSQLIITYSDCSCERRYL